MLSPELYAGIDSFLCLLFMNNGGSGATLVLELQKA